MHLNSFRKPLLLLFLASSCNQNQFPTVTSDLEKDRDNPQLTLNRWQKDPKGFMAAKSLKWDRNGKLLKDNALQLFESKQIQSKQYLAAKDDFRTKVCRYKSSHDRTLVCLKDLNKDKAQIQKGDDPQELIDQPDSMLTTLEQMAELLGPELKASIRQDQQPWSDYYWAIYQGGVGMRYKDRYFDLSNSDWKAKFDYICKDLFKNSEVSEEQYCKDAEQDSSKAPAYALSPAEKYDLLIGDEQRTLTKLSWLEGYNEYFSDDGDRIKGEVERWQGKCHGWAAVSFNIPRPLHSFKLLAARNDKDIWIQFFPDDIKALATLLWSQTRVPSKFVGGRCYKKDPKVDDSMGRVIEQECFDTNPGTWHQAIVHQIAKVKRSFVMDKTFDYEVWNQPVLGFQYYYFNPVTNQLAANLEQAKVSYREFKVHDRFSHLKVNGETVNARELTPDSQKLPQNQQKNIKSVVGIIMDVSYMIETFPAGRDLDGPQFDAVYTDRLVYDVELDDQGNIIGGEWYSQAHPDFLWLPYQDSVDYVRTRADEYLAESLAENKKWTPNLTADKPQRVPPYYVEAARRYIYNYGTDLGIEHKLQPLALIVNKLVELSNKPPQNDDESTESP